MDADETAAIVARLSALYPQVLVDHITDCVQQAAATVARQLGSADPDPVIVEGLAQLRLSVRAAAGFRQTC